jgi:hypothetical protein
MSPAPRGVRTTTDAGHLDHGFRRRTPHGQVAYCKEEALPHVQAVPSAGSLDAHERGERAQQVIVIAKTSQWVHRSFYNQSVG